MVSDLNIREVPGWFEMHVIMLGAICGSAISMDLPAQSVDP